ncbi:DNA mismatch repair protein MutT [Streptomyces nigrescens]|uniref:DNA mismatch repair protein MutT n=1 Tax=Streptomyces nigrescens TaxID=1920 RepID=A0ABN6R731_STRNI|nr:NUDIX hydrolase [Streptomyces nigrescens]BDM72933.1 DNA mismatch repair protein MutT [Streptomyces nigrescens]
MTAPGERPARKPDARKPDARKADARKPDAGKAVRAAGCVLWRRRPSAEHGLEIALVHRPKYDDWSHPKGKLKRGEDALAGAVREVAEETGMDCRPGAPLPTSYYFANGRPKQVRYWAAEALAGAFTPTDEVDRLVWLPPEEARGRLTQERDRPLVDALLAALHLA